MPPQLARAQGFFDQFFSGWQLPPPPPRPYGPGARFDYRDRFDPYQSYGDGSFGGDTTYRTLCVRLCDGYYFPISFSTVRSEFARDADKCQASCGSGARLYYHPNPGGDPESMVDLTGLGYAALPTAFKYRKALVDGCACHPEMPMQAQIPAEKLDTDGATSGGSTMGASIQPAVPDRGATAVVQPMPSPRYVPPSSSQLTYGQTPQRPPVARKQGSPGAFFR